MTTKSLLRILCLTMILLSACAVVAPPAPTLTPTPTRAQPTPSPLPPTATLAPSATPEPTATPYPTPDYPPQGMGPTNFPADVNPLTGLKVADPAALDRRPLLIKVENLPRDDRPQFGLSRADLVYEYYTEQGGTRFAAIFYGTDAEKVGPIRSGRFFDTMLVPMYRAVFVFGSAYWAVWNRIVNSDFSSRLVLENNFSCPALCRFEPEKRNFLMANTAEMNAYLKSRGIDNTRQALDGMFFQMQPPEGGEEGGRVFVRYSGAIYNRWDYDSVSGRYLRFVDAQNDVNRNNEVYVQLTDQLTGEPIAADNVVTMCVPHQYFYRSNEIEVVEILLDPNAGRYTACDGQQYDGGSGPAWLARDGKVYRVTYRRAGKDTPLTLLGSDGQPFPFKPGQTWFEVIGASSKVEQQADGAWRFTFGIVP